MFAMKNSCSEISKIVSEEHHYVLPTKAVKSISDMQLWENSQAYYEYLGFVLALNEACKGKSNSVNCPMSETANKLLTLLDKLDSLIDETPPLEQPQRFGNQAFRQWYDKLKNGAIKLLQDLLPESLHRAINEIMIYLLEGFGNQTRIDYGTGHEISFVMFVCSLFKIDALNDGDKLAIVCKIFPQYLDVVRKLQQTYRMEPAGSHGVWSLDDYQFLPFIWGSSQLVAHPKIEPASFLNNNIVEEFHKDYLFLSCIKYINEVKKGPFAEHSNQLWGVSGVSNWTKVNQGLIKMYKAEVLAKFPVIQHIYFGSIFQFKPFIRPQRSVPILTPSKVENSKSDSNQIK